MSLKPYQQNIHEEVTWYNSFHNVVLSILTSINKRPSWIIIWATKYKIEKLQQIEYLGITHFSLKLLNFMIHLSFPLKAFNLIHVLMLKSSKIVRETLKPSITSMVFKTKRIGNIQVFFSQTLCKGWAYNFFSCSSIWLTRSTISGSRMSMSCTQNSIEECEFYFIIVVILYLYKTKQQLITQLNFSLK